MVHEVFHVLRKNPDDEKTSGQGCDRCPTEPPQGTSCDLGNGDVAGLALIAVGGKTRNLHEIEVVQQANPGNTGKDVEVPEPEVM